jgi:hypothetical protein
MSTSSSSSSSNDSSDSSDSSSSISSSDSSDSSDSSISSSDSSSGSGGDDDDLADHRTAAGYGLSLNQYGGLYQRGKAYDIPTKLAVANSLHTQGIEVNIKKPAERWQVSRAFVKKVWDEVLRGEIVDPRNIKQGRDQGPGVKTFNEFDHWVLLFLYLHEPSRSNGSYVDNLYAITGTGTSKTTISRWFKDFFPINGGFRKPNLVPVDKFKPRNLWRAAEYAEAISIIAPHKL